MGRLERVGLATLAVIFLAACGNDRMVQADGTVQVVPESVDFGRVALGTAADREVLVRNLGRGPLSIEKLQIPGLGKDMQILGPAGTIIGGQSTRLLLRYTPAQEEVMQRTLEVSVDDPQKPLVPVPVQGLAMRPQVTPDPLTLDFGRIEVGARREMQLTLINDFNVAVDVRVIRSGDPTFSISSGHANVPASGRGSVPVVFAPDRLGDAIGQLEILPCPTCVPVIVALHGTGIARALVVNPDPVNFGSVPLDRSGTATITLLNDGSLPLKISSITDPAGGNDENAFKIHPPGTPITLAAGQSITFTATFSASRLGPNKDSFRIASSSHASPVTDVPMLGTGGGPEIRVDPVISFGRVPIGARAYADLRIDDVGGDPPQLLVPPVVGVPGVEITAGAPLFGIENPPGMLSIPAGQSGVVRVYFEPTADGEAEGDSVVRSNDGSQPEVHVRLVGHAYLAAQCTMHVEPQAIDFGSLDVGHGAILGYRIYDDSSEPCIIRGIDLAPGSDPAFDLPGGRVESFVAAPFTTGDQMVAFDPAHVGAGAGSYHGVLHMTVINSATPDVNIPLTALSEDGCLVADPTYLDFGLRQHGCGAEFRTVHLTNRCAAPTDVDRITIGPQAVAGDFEISAAPGTPLTLNTGDGFDVHVQWNALSAGQSFGPLYIQESHRSAPFLVALYAEAAQSGATTDHFVQHASQAADVLIVMDNSSSMRGKQDAAAAAVGALVGEAQRRGIDFHVGVTTTGLVPGTGAPACPGGADGGEAGRLFPVDNSRPRIVTSATANPVGVLQANLHVGLCHNLEQGLEAMRLALSEPLVSNPDDPATPQPMDGNGGFLRQGAPLGVIFISDEDDHSGPVVSDYLDFLNRLKGQGGTVVDAIVDTGPGVCPDASGVGARYMQLVQATGGTTLPICSPDFSTVFRDIAARTFTPKNSFTLSRTPDKNATLQVRVDGRDATGTYRFDAATNSITFNTAPAPGAQVEVTYVSGCP